ncbi:RecT family recombinase [Peribacillus muralis]|uniref:RecT family recombinase n=1 Tax=Peribacillus muralis TaxID=264697 RepID=UPI00382207DF
MTNNNQLAEIKAFTEGEIQTIRHTLAKDATPDQFNLFIRTAAASGLNPMLNHIYCIVYGGKMSLQVSVEGIMYLAKRVEGYQGVDVQLVYENDAYKAKRVRDESGRYYWDVEHEISSDPSKVIGCYAFAYREGFPPVFEYLKVEEVQHNLTGNNSSLWKKYFNDMYKKHVIKRAAKRQYGIEINEDDAPSVGASEIPEYKPQERKDITPNQEVIDRPKKPSKPENEDIDAIDEAKTEMVKKFERLGIPKGKARTEYITKNAKDIKGEPSLPQLLGLLELMDMHIEMHDAQLADNDELE